MLLSETRDVLYLNFKHSHTPPEHSQVQKITTKGKERNDKNRKLENMLDSFQNIDPTSASRSDSLRKLASDYDFYF